MGERAYAIDLKDREPGPFGMGGKIKPAVPRTLQDIEGLKELEGNKELNEVEDLNSEFLSATEPSKSPSSGIHKPTWKPTQGNREPGPKGLIPKVIIPRPRTLEETLSDKDLDSRILSETKPSKSPSSGLHKPTWKPSTNKSNKKPSKSPSSGLHKPTWKPTTNKPIESSFERMLESDDKNPTKSPSSGIHKPTWKPTQGNREPGPKGLIPKVIIPRPRTLEETLSDKDIDIRILSALNPTKSPSSGLHKPTWKPTSKLVEDRGTGPETRSGPGQQNKIGGEGNNGEIMKRFGGKN